MRSSIIVAETAAGINGVSVADVSSTITNTGGFGGVRGNREADPRFVNADAFDLHLRPGSPAIDAAAAGAPDSDGDCRARVGNADIGAFEYGAPARAKFALERRGWGEGTITADPAGLECGPARTFVPGEGRSTPTRRRARGSWPGRTGRPSCSTAASSSSPASTPSSAGG